ncbi:MAG: hypothetical protein AAF585_00375 [Verrucomicrobiota bacterium]
MRMTKRQAVAKAQAAIANYEEQIRAFQGERAQADRDMKIYAQQAGEALGQLAAAWVGAGTEADVTAISTVLPQTKLRGVMNQCAQQLQDNRQRVEEISRDDSYQNRDHLLTKEFPSIAADIGRRHQAIDGELEPFRCEEFEYALAENLHISPKASGLRGVWETVIGKARRKRKTLEFLDERFGGGSLTVLVDQYQVLEAKLEGIEQEQASHDAQKKALEDLVVEHDGKSQMIANFDAFQRGALTQALTQELTGINLETLVGLAPVRLKDSIAVCHALQKKSQYTRDLLAYLDGEIRDRQNRIRSVANAQAKWRRYPNGYVGDKTKWLETIPNMKREGTRKRTNWSRQTRSCLGAYDGYTTYGNHMWNSHYHHRPFLAFDVFNFRADERMPYEGFSRQVVRELDTHREANNQEGPPKEWLQEDAASVAGEDGAVDEEALPLLDEVELGPEDLDMTGMEELGWEGDEGEVDSGIEEDVGIENDHDFGDEAAEAFADEADDGGDIGDVS